MAESTVNGSHSFVIEGYSLVKGMGTGKYIASENFTVGGYQWSIYFYPDGMRRSDYVSASIALASEGSDVRAYFELTLVDLSGNENHHVLNDGPHTLKYQGSMWRCELFYKRHVLKRKRSDFLKGDCFKINCTIRVVVKSYTEGPRTYVVELPPSDDFGKCLGSLLETENLSDCIFKVGVEQALETFNAHKAVLAARSPYFRALFRYMLNDDPVKVLGIKSCVFQVMLLFIYTDSLPEEITCNSEEVVPISQNLLVAVDMYFLDRLKVDMYFLVVPTVSMPKLTHRLASQTTFSLSRKYISAATSRF